MSGHSHWAGIKHKKAANDAKRGKIFSKIARRITIAAKAGGGDTDTNLELRYALDDARACSMPKDNIERAVKKGLGDLDGVDYVEIVYEGYGPGGVALMIEALTDNRNRTAGEIRKIFDRNGGSLGATGCVAWMFERKGLIIVDADGVEEDDLMMAVMESGGEDMKRVGDVFEITTEVAALSGVKEAIEAGGITVSSAKIENLPANTIDLDASAARRVLRLMDSLDDQDDTQNISANFNITDEVMAELDSE